MKVLNLLCAHQHAFEGWFGSEEDFQSQLSRGLVECPLCGDTAIHKGLTAPRLNLGRSGQQADAAPAQHAAAAQAPGATTDVVTAPADPALQAAWLQAVRHVMANTEDVGNRFAEEARRIHYGEADERGIRGQASQRETAELLEEGIAVMPLAVPKAFKGPLQ